MAVSSGGCEEKEKQGKVIDNRYFHLVCKLFLVFLIPSLEPRDCSILQPCYPDWQEQCWQLQYGNCALRVQLAGLQCGGGKINFPPTFLNSSGWTNNQINIRQGNKTKCPNLVHIIIWGFIRICETLGQIGQLSLICHLDKGEGGRDLVFQSGNRQFSGR